MCVYVCNGSYYMYIVIFTPLYLNCGTGKPWAGQRRVKLEPDALRKVGDLAYSETFGASLDTGSAEVRLDRTSL